MLNKRFFAGFFALTTILVSAPSVSANPVKEMRILTVKETRVLTAKKTRFLMANSTLQSLPRYIFNNQPYEFSMVNVPWGKEFIEVPIINELGAKIGLFKWHLEWNPEIDSTSTYWDNNVKQDKNRTKRDFQRINDSTKNKEAAFIKE